MKLPKLKIGLILDSLTVNAWVYHAIGLVKNSDSLEIALIILNGEEEDYGTSHKKSSLIFDIFQSIDGKIFNRKMDALEKKSLASLAAQIPVISAFPFSGMSNKGLAELTQQVKDAELDILVQFGGKSIMDEARPAATYGCWKYHFGEEDTHDEKITGYWEVIRKNPLTKAELISVGNDGWGSRMIYQSQIATYMLSPARNRSSIYWFASSFLIRQLELLHLHGSDFFSKATPQNEKCNTAEEWETCRLPNTAEAVKHRFILLGRILKEFVQRLMYKEAWYLMVNFGESPEFEIKNFKKITPPEDRFWADPFIIQKDGGYYIFVEEFPFKNRKGRISVVELDSKGDVKGNYPILEKGYHLSYPCVFEDEGSYFMVPESSAKKSIDLFECERTFDQWKFKMSLMQDVIAVDPTIFFYAGRYWLFAGMRAISGIYPDVELFLFFSDSLMSQDWTPHPLNPVVSDVSRARPAGGLFMHDGKLYRPSQNCLESYGNSFNINEIFRLTETEYHEEKVFTVHPDGHHQFHGTHTFNYSNRLSIIDAYYRKNKWFK